MTILGRIKKLADEQKMSLVEIEEKSGLAKNAIYKLDRQTPRVDKIEKIASTLGTSVDYLLGRTNDRFASGSIDQTDIGKQADALLAGLDLNTSVNYYGEPMTDDQKQQLKTAILLALEMNKKKAEKKNKAGD
ncbi:MAG: helix-turn-helix transcriptional regulator [Liquorilactobacillus sp.]